MKIKFDQQLTENTFEFKNQQLNICRYVYVEKKSLSHPVMIGVIVSDSSNKVSFIFDDLASITLIIFKFKAKHFASIFEEIKEVEAELFNKVELLNLI
jgi:hypothetical protein